MIRKATKTRMPEQLLQQVQQVQETKQSRDRRFAWLVGATVLAFTMLVAMVIESQLNLFSYTLRFGLTILSLATTIICTRTLWLRGKQENERLLSAAKDVDAAYPSLKQRVATLASFEENRLGEKSSAHPAMLNRLSEEATQIHQQVESKAIVSHRLLKRPLICLAVAGLVMISMFVWDAPKAAVQLGRFWAPWANLSTTKVVAVEADSVVARNEPIKLSASLSGKLVDEVEFYSKEIETSELSTTRIWPSTKDESVAKFRQAKADKSFDYRFRAGDGQTDWHRVTVADRPKIEELTMRIVPPDYTGKPARTYSKLPKKLKVVMGSHLEVVVKPKNDVRTARLVMGKTNWLSMEPSSNGEYDCSYELRQPTKFEVQLTELHGLQNRRPPRCFLQVVADQAPKVKILKPTKTTVLLPDEEIDIHFKASDDHGVKKMLLRVYTQREGEDDATVHEVAIPIDPKANNKKIKGSVALDLAQFDLQDGDTIRYEIRASDNFRPLEDLNDPSVLQPMEGVQMAQAEESEDAPAQTQASNSQRKPAESSAPVAPADSEITQSTPQSNSDVTPSTEKDVASNSASGSQPPSSADPAMAESQEAEQTMRKTQNPRSAEADLTPKESMAKTESNKDQIDKPTAPDEENPSDASEATEKVAAAANPSNSASNENKIKASREEDKIPAEAPDASKIAKSSSPSEKNATGENSSASQDPSSSKSKPSASKHQQANASSKASSPPKTATNEKPKSDPQEPSEEQDSTQPKSTPDQMAQRSPSTDGQSSSSGQQQIKVDKYAGGFTSDHREELEIAIDPTLELLKQSLVESGKDVRVVMNPTAEEPVSAAAAERALSRADVALDTASEAVIELNQETRNTPYAFVGLRLESIRLADVAPAWDDVREASDAVGEPRVKYAGSAWNHINRALATLAKLEEKYEQVKRDLKKADDILKFKKMYAVYVDGAMAMLNANNSALNGQNRKGAEFDLDEEYLKRLKEVLEMRRDMMAELARILADDPQLLRRYINQMNDRNWSIRDQLSLITRNQRELSRKIHAWADATKKPQELSALLIDVTEYHLSDVQALANRVADLQDKFVSWLPLEDDAEKGDAAETMSDFKTAGNDLTEIVANVEEILLKSNLQSNFDGEISFLLEKATGADEALRKATNSLQRMINSDADFELANNAARRLPTLQLIRRDLQQWIGKLELLKEDLVNEVYSVDQENRRDELLQYTVKIASLESQLIAALQDEDAQLPSGVASKTKELQKLLDVEIPADQLVASQTLLDGAAAFAKQQQTDIVAKFEQAETTFSEILQAITDELDKLPVNDPIASLLQDPTLDEILSQLENEQDFLEELGISRRPTNLSAGGGRNSMLSQLMAQQRRMRNLSNRAYRNALARARTKNKSKKKPRLAKDNERWNILVGQLGEKMLQGDNKIPPERYRSAIDQYFEQISKLKNGNETE